MAPGPRRIGSWLRCHNSNAFRRTNRGELLIKRVMSAVLIAAVVAAIVFVFLSRSTTTRTSLPPVGAGYWHTHGTTILDAYNRPIRIASVTWFGEETTTWVPGGLDFQPYKRILNEIKRYGYNAIRIPYSNELVEENPVVTNWVRANPQFRGKHALSVLNAVVHYAGHIGLKIIFDDQSSAAVPSLKNHPAGIGDLQEPLWYTKKYPESSWIRDWVRLARLYRGNSTVIGFDLRNEPHTAGVSGHPWDLYAYLHWGATWGPYRGKDNVKTDWRLAAERCGDAVLKANPHLLIFVEGLQLYPESQKPHGVDSYWWGGILRQVRKYPVKLNVSHQLVYSPHEYGPDKWPYYSWWKHLTYKKLAREFTKQWGYILNHPKAPYAAPIFLGETGTCTYGRWCVEPVKPRPNWTKFQRISHKQGKWLHLMVLFLRRHPAVGWSLWALNGTNALDQAADDGLLNRDWSGLQSKALQRVLARAQKA